MFCQDAGVSRPQVVAGADLLALVAEQEPQIGDRHRGIPFPRGHLVHHCDGIVRQDADYTQDIGQSASVYVRPHELLIQHQRNGAASIGAKVLHVNPAGSRIKVELQTVESEQLINAELTNERFDELDLKPGALVYVSATRVRVFVPQTGEQAGV